MRFRWSVLYAAISILGVYAALIISLKYYAMQQDEAGGYAIEGPEFFGFAFAMMASFIFAISTLAIGGVMAIIRQAVVKGRHQAEHC
jgi:hypothetical protein